MLLLVLHLFFILIEIGNQQTLSKPDKEKYEFADFLIEYLYSNYPNFLPKLLRQYRRASSSTVRNETYKGYVLEMRRKNGYDVLLADAYKQKLKSHIFESGKRPLTVLYQCSNAIRYCSGNPKYCELREGDMGTNVILVAAHGGNLSPKSIPNRDAGCYINHKCVYSHKCVNEKKGIKKNFSKCATEYYADVFTQNITFATADAIEELSGTRPHIVISNLHRKKLDVNRMIDLGTFHVPEAVQAWQDFQKLIEIAKDNLNGHMGLIVDIHGNIRKEKWNMFGYGLVSQYLNAETVYPNQTSIRNLGEYVTVPFNDLLRGNNSLAHLMEMQGYNSVPSMINKQPGNNAYFSGGYIIRKHGSKYSGFIDAVQVEIHKQYRTTEKYKSFSNALAKSIIQYMYLNYANKGVPMGNPQNPRANNSVGFSTQKMYFFDVSKPNTSSKIIS